MPIYLLTNPSKKDNLIEYQPILSKASGNLRIMLRGLIPKSPGILLGEGAHREILAGLICKTSLRGGSTDTGSRSRAHLSNRSPMMKSYLILLWSISLRHVPSRIQVQRIWLILIGQSPQSQFRNFSANSFKFEGKFNQLKLILNKKTLFPNQNLPQLNKT